MFLHLHAAGLISSPTFKTPKIGGKYGIIEEDGVPKVLVVEGGSLTMKQARSLQAKMSEILGEVGEDWVKAEKQGDDDKKWLVKVRLG
jgi:hypothetical protein